MKNKIMLAACALLLSLSAFAGGQKRKVLIIGLDGTRADALLLSNSPNIDSLAANGFYTFDSWHIDITVSGPSWSSIMTGVYHNKHGVTDNSYTGSDYWDYPYFPTRAKEIKPNLRCVQRTEWAPMSDYVYNDGWNQKLVGPDAQTVTTGDAAVGLVADPNVDALFIYFDAVDVTGHSSGFSPTNPAYMAAIEGIDVQIGRILCALKSRPTYNQEDWLVLLTTDHGGIGTGHGGNSIYERDIWWIGYSDRGAHGVNQALTAPTFLPQDTFMQNASYVEYDTAYNKTQDPGTYNPMIIEPHIPTPPNISVQKMALVQADLPVTALHHLIFNSQNNIIPDTVAAWNLDGRSWLHDMGLDNDDTTKNANVWTCQNPASGIKDVKLVDFSMHAAYFTGYVTLFIPTASENNTVRIYNLQGQLVYEEQFATTGVKHNIALSNLPHGNYVLELQQNDKSGAKIFNW